MLDAPKLHVRANNIVPLIAVKMNFFFYLMLRPRSLIHEFMCSNVRLPPIINRFDAVAKKKKKSKNIIKKKNATRFKRV